MQANVLAGSNEDTLRLLTLSSQWRVYISKLANGLC